MPTVQGDQLFRSISKAIVLAAVLVAILWLLQKVVTVLLIFLLAIVFVIVINAPVSFLEKKGIRRGWAAFFTFTSIFLIISLLAWIVLPIIYHQLQELFQNIPTYIETIRTGLSSWAQDYPAISQEIQKGGAPLTKWVPSIPRLLAKVSDYSLTFLGFIFLSIIFICIVVYAVSKPRPLLKIYYSLFPVNRRDDEQVALIHTSTMLRGWMKANLIGGTIEAVCTTTFLSIMNVPGAWVWGTVALFAELIPNLGFYIMAVPPTILAFSVSPMTALWVFVFFIVLSEIMTSFVMPKLIASNMNLQPVVTLFMLLVMGTAFGLIGALLTIPMTAIIKAYYSAFNKGKDDSGLDKRIDEVLYHQ